MHIVRAFLILYFCIFFCSHAVAENLPGPLVETDWLANNLDKVVVLDVRSNAKNFLTDPIFNVNKKTGNKELLIVAGHIPGARHIPYEKVRTTKNVNGLKIKNLIPDKQQFEKLMQQAGVNENNLIVVVSNAENGSDLNAAARMYWQIKYYGHNNVAILNGGTAQWILDGREVRTKALLPEPGNWQATAQQEEILATSEEVALAIENKAIQLLDVRSLGEYLGVNNAKGHIPNASLFPVELISTGRLPIKFASNQELSVLADLFKADTKGEVITYCNSGHMASGSWFVMYALLGNEKAALYDGSMTQWNAEKRPTVRMQFQ